MNPTNTSSVIAGMLKSQGSPQGYEPPKDTEGKPIDANRCRTDENYRLDNWKACSIVAPLTGPKSRWEGGTTQNIPDMPTNPNLPNPLPLVGWPEVA